MQNYKLLSQTGGESAATQSLIKTCQAGSSLADLARKSEASETHKQHSKCQR